MSSFLVNVELSESEAFGRCGTDRSGFSWAWHHAVQKGRHVHKNTQKKFIMKPVQFQILIGTSRCAVLLLNKLTFIDYIRPNSIYEWRYIVLATCSGCSLSLLQVNMIVFRNSFICRSQWPCSIRPSVCECSSLRIAGSILAEGTDVRPLCLLCAA